MQPKFDPINESLSIYLDCINIFVRMLMIMNGGKKK
jgi:FtsH-binding integral membrane protein